MEGYHFLKQYVEDRRLYQKARLIDPYRMSGMTITRLMNLQIKQRIDNASKTFKNMIKKNNYTKDDLLLIAAHDTSRRIEDLDSFLIKCFGKMYVDESLYKRFFQSNAFKSGRLKMLYPLVPRKMADKQDLYRFIRSQPNVSSTGLAAMMRQMGIKQWKQWLYELIEQKKVIERGGSIVG